MAPTPRVRAGATCARSCRLDISEPTSLTVWRWNAMPLKQLASLNTVSRRLLTSLSAALLRHDAAHLLASKTSPRVRAPDSRGELWPSPELWSRGVFKPPPEPPTAKMLPRFLRFCGFPKLVVPGPAEAFSEDRPSLDGLALPSSFAVLGGPGSDFSISRLTVEAVASSAGSPSGSAGAAAATEALRASSGIGGGGGDVGSTSSIQEHISKVWNNKLRNVTQPWRYTFYYDYFLTPRAAFAKLVAQDHQMVMRIREPSAVRPAW